MQWQSLSLFATPVIKIQIPGYLQARDFFFERINQQVDAAKLRKEHNHITHYFSESNVFKAFPELAWLSDELEKAGTFAYCELLNYRKSRDLKLTNAWFNLCDVGGVQNRHSHANCRLSGTLYLNTDDNTRIRFMHPLSTSSMHTEIYDQPSEDDNPYGLGFHFPFVDVAVQAGDCLFWPSQLHHGYDTNKTPNRLSLSFNLMPQHMNTIYQIV